VGVSLAMLMASATGPKVSSLVITMSVVTSVSTVGSKKVAALRGALAAGDELGAPS